MITINIYYKGENGNAKRFADEMTKSGLVDEIRNEEGNLGYSYFFSSDDPDVVLLIDKWKDQSAIDVHHSSPMMKEIARLRDKYSLSMRVERFVLDENEKQDEKIYDEKHFLTIADMPRRFVGTDYGKQNCATRRNHNSKHKRTAKYVGIG